MVFYRKYRPQKIEDLDSESVRDSLLLIFSRKTYPHAFLFTGPKGLGKTSSARIVAKGINCINRKSAEPCNKCDQCVSITNGNNLDVMEIDGASNRGIDEIRDLKEKIKLSPFKALKKVYIIDEVHMLTTEAFNALLKTLEDPPGHAVFILCTTEPQKVPATIASRCFKVNFAKATSQELVRSMQRIVKHERIKIDKEALFEIAKLSDGSFRDGANVLEEVSVFAGRKNITAALVNEKFNMLGIGENVSKMLEALAKKDVKKGLLICRELAGQGTDFKFFIEEMINKLHLMLLMEVGIERPDGPQKLNLADIGKLFELLSKAHQETKYSVLEQMPLELAVLEWGEKDEKNNHPKDVPSLTSGSSGQTFPINSKNSFFEKLIEEVKSHNHMVAGVLRSCSVKEVLDGKLDIMASSKFHKEKLEEAKNLELLENTAEQILGEKVKVNISLKGVK